MITFLGSALGFIGAVLFVIFSVYIIAEALAAMNDLDK